VVAATVLSATNVDVAGIDTTVFRGGHAAAGRSPIVFLHAAGGITADDPFLAELATTHEVVAPVHPGFNDLAEIDDIRDVHDLALRLDDVFDALGLDRATVVGHSFGGMVAAELAAHVPHRVAKLVLLAPLGLWNDDYPVADLFVAFPGAIQKLLWADPDSDTARSFGGTPNIIGLLQGLTSAGKFLWPIPDKGLGRRLRRITADTLVVWGADDQLAPARYADDFAAAIANAEPPRVLDGAGHMVPYERQAEVVELIAAFTRG
jgi:pimeloyl-ACP methyl ester carboxylesterase